MSGLSCSRFRAVVPALALKEHPNGELERFEQHLQPGLQELPDHSWKRKQHTHNPKIINDHKKHSKIPNFSSKKERNCSWSSCVVLLGSCVDFLWKVHAYQPYYGHAIPFKQNSFKNSGIACLAGKSLWTFLFMSTEIPWYAGPVKE